MELMAHPIMQIETKPFRFDEAQKKKVNWWEVNSVMTVWPILLHSLQKLA